jgi:predicted nuclease of predicted toxin-antitoxin system
MKLLLDANLSWRLCQHLAADYPGIEHVKNIPSSQPATDEEIWEYAKTNACTIVTNDEDFLRLQMQRGFPPKLVLLRMGNQQTTFLKEVLLRRKNDIEALEVSEEYGFIEVYE